MSIQPPFSEEQLLEVERLLGRKPRGLREIAVARKDGAPMVIRVASIVEGKPFPTLYWLIDPEICLRIDREEAGGLIKSMQSEVDASPALQASMAADHRDYIARREDFMTREDREALQAGGLGNALAGKGIGGIGDFRFIRCLHTWYGAHLVVPNTIGRMLDERWSVAG